MEKRTWLPAVLALVMILASCAPSAALDGRPDKVPAVSGTSNSTPTRIVAAFPADPPAVYNSMNPPGVGGQGNALQELGLAGLTIYDSNSGIHPQLAEAVPSVEN